VVSTALHDEAIAAWLTWQRRPFPDANLRLLRGREPALADSGFTGHARETADWVHKHAGQVTVVVYANWHSDHTGGNAGADDPAQRRAGKHRRRHPDRLPALACSRPLRPPVWGWSHVRLAAREGRRRQASRRARRPHSRFQRATFPLRLRGHLP